MHALFCSNGFTAYDDHGTFVSYQWIVVQEDHIELFWIPQ